MKEYQEYEVYTILYVLYIFLSTIYILVFNMVTLIKTIWSNYYNKIIKLNWVSISERTFPCQSYHTLILLITEKYIFSLSIFNVNCRFH